MIGQERLDFLSLRGRNRGSGNAPARYLWAMLLARIYESAPLACPQCGQEMRIIALTYKDVLMLREAGCRERS